MLNKSIQCPFIKTRCPPSAVGQANLFATGNITKTGNFEIIGEGIENSRGFLLKTGGFEIIGEGNIPNVLSNLIEGNFNIIAECLGIQQIQSFEPDKNKVFSFVNQEELIINHDLDKYPDVSAINSEGQEIYVSVDYVSISEIRAYWNGLASGKIFLN
jgi:hypothetical protein